MSTCGADGVIKARVATSTLCARRKLIPSLIVIGSLKTGTTSLWASLVDHAKSHITPGALTHKGDVSRKEKDFFGDPSMWRMGPQWYAKIWPACDHSHLQLGIDATPAYHVWHDAPKNMGTFFGPKLPELRLVWMMREPVSKFWSYFWELKMYGGEFERMTFAQFVAPKLARTQQCLALDPKSNLWPPSMPPPFTGCAPHLDHGLYHPQLMRWLQYFAPSQLLVVSFSGFVSEPAEVARDVLLHAGLPPADAAAAAARVKTDAQSAHRKKMENSRSKGRGRMSAKLWMQLHAFYAPFVERLYGVLHERQIAVSPCREMGTRFLDPLTNASGVVLPRRGKHAGGGDGRPSGVASSS